jgi:hypothetical protein
VRKDISYPEALALQDLVWNAAWAGLTEEICGLEVLPITPLHFVRLASARSPFVCGGREPNMADAGNFLWCLSPLYDPHSKWKKFQHWLCYYRATRKLTLPELVSGIDEYMDEAWQDAPPKPESRGRKASAYYSPVVSIMRTLCPEYNVTPATVLNLPYKCIFQLYKPVAESLDLPVTAPAQIVLWREKARTRKAAA